MHGVKTDTAWLADLGIIIQLEQQKHTKCLISLGILDPDIVFVCYKNRDVISQTCKTISAKEIFTGSGPNHI